MIADIKTLEFDLVLKRVASFAATDLAMEALIDMQPSNNASYVKELVEKTDEILQLLYKLGTPPLGNIYNIYPHLKRLEVGGTLSAKELREILMHLVVVNQNKRYSARVKNEQFVSTYYTELVENLTHSNDLDAELRNAIDEDGNILDTASFELASIRKKIINSHAAVEEKLNQFISKNSGMLNDTIITQRNGRYVVPIKVEYKNKVNGVIQDYSQSGETVFVEPTQVMELTNKIAILKGKEQTEIEKILIELSNHVATFIEEFRLNLDLLIDLDITQAKASYARELECTKVDISDEINLRKARHPLLDQSTVVSNDIIFNEYKAVIITGPNTGGKTVTLKTLGLLAMMNQSGMLLPVIEGSTLPIFDNIFADIGDEQSIEQSLSTFSSHMTNLIRITENVTIGSLVLFDELGSGTDPKEGASLAISLVNYIKARGTYLMATTHYPELKAYAYNEVDTINASTEFNVDTLSPTYKLSIGIPGRSNAFEISRRLGLNEKIIKAAESQTTTSETEIANLIKKLESETHKVQELEEELHQIRKDLLSEKAEVQKEKATLQERRLKFQDEKEAEARKYMAEVKTKAQDIIDDLLKMGNDVKYHKIVEQKSKLGKIIPEKEKVTSTKKETLKVGDQVIVLPYQKSANIITVLPNNYYEVKMGILTTKMHKRDLEFVRRKEVKKTTATIAYKRNKNVKMELDLRGERFEDAIRKVEKYIDDLLQAGMKKASIIHGHGTNALKMGVHDYLATCPYIASYGYGKEGEGGSGVTNIELK